MGLALAVLKLIKYKLSLAVTLSGAAGYFLFPDHNAKDILLLIPGLFLLSGGSAALNQVQEKERDLLMDRTKGRPLPSGKITAFTGLLTAVLFMVAGTLILQTLGSTPTWLGILNVFLYNGVYTWMKPRSSFAVLPGGLVGAIPPVIGWTAAGGILTHPTIIFVATIMFLWQMPHFWLLVIRYGTEYEAAGFATIRRRMDDSQIKRLVFWWMTLSLVFLMTAPLFGIHLKTWVLAILALFNLTFIALFYRILFRKGLESKLRLVFILTNIFLTILLLGLILNSIL